MQSNRIILFIPLLLTVGWLDAQIEQLNPNVNAKFWFAGALGAFILRLLMPDLTIRQHLTGWLVGFISACLWATDIHSFRWLVNTSEFAVWGGTGFAFDFVLQLVVMFFQATKANPMGTLGTVLDTGEKVATLWGKIKTNALDLFSTLFTKK